MNVLKTTLLLGLLTGLILACGAALGGRSGMAIALVFAAGTNFFAYWFSDKLVLRSTGARPITPEEAPRLHAVVDRLAERAGIPKPSVHLMPSPSPNAFATGRNPKHAAIAVTQGLLDLMDDDEIEGVVAHELGHVQNRDILISSVAATIAGAVTFMASMAQWGALFGGGGRDDREGGIVGLLATAILAPIAALVIQMAVSRSREYGADATGAQLTGNPHGLARALEKLARASKQVPLPVSPAAAHMFIMKPFSLRAAARLFSTHPPVEERVRRLLAR